MVRNNNVWVKFDDDLVEILTDSEAETLTHSQKVVLAMYSKEINILPGTIIPQLTKNSLEKALENPTLEHTHANDPTRRKRLSLTAG